MTLSELASSAGPPELPPLLQAAIAEAMTKTGPLRLRGTTTTITLKAPPHKGVRRTRQRSCRARLAVGERHGTPEPGVWPSSQCEAQTQAGEDQRTPEVRDPLVGEAHFHSGHGKPGPALWRTD